MHTKWIRGGFVVLALVAVLGLVLVACHKKEGVEQSQGISAPAAPAQIASAPVVAVPAPAPAAPVVAPPVHAAPAPAQLAARVTSQPDVLAPMGKEFGRRQPTPVSATMALPTPARPDGDERMGLRVDPSLDLPLADGTPVQGLTVVVSDLPTNEEPNQEVIHRLRAKKQPVAVTPVPGADTDINLQDCSDPNTPPSTLLSGEDTRANVGTGNYNLSFSDWNAASTGGVPFDVDMAAGTTQIVTDVNTSFRVYDKAGVSLAGPTTYRSFWSGLTNCGAVETSTSFLADPQISYDDENDRWVMLTLRAQLNTSGLPLNSQICLACSKTGDATGAWWKYELTDGSGLADYPHLGIGEDAIFVGVNHFSTAGAYDNAVVWAINKTSAYAGTATTRRVTAGTTIFTPQPAERRGSAQGHYPPTGTPHYFVARDSSLNAVIWRFTQPSLTSGTFTTWATLQADGGAPPDITGTNITPSPIDGGDQRPMDVELRWPYLWYTRGALATQGSIQWAGANVSGTNPVVYQSGEYSDANRTFHWSDCTVDRNQNFVIGFTGANNATTTYPGAYITGREDGVTANNTLESYVVAKAGEVKYNTWEDPADGSWRWGDYAGVAIDPNGCDIWFAGQYTANTGTGNPQTKTWVRNYKFASCVAGASRQAYLSGSTFQCHKTVSATIIDTAGTPTNAVWHTTSGAPYAATITGGPNNFPIAAASLDQLGAADGDDVWLTFTGDDAVTYSSPHAKVDCSLDVCVTLVDPLTGGCDSDAYTDRNETLSVKVQMTNNELYDLPTGFMADLVVDPAYPDANITIVNGTAEWDALAAGASAYPAGAPFQVRYTGSGTGPIQCHYKVQNIRATNATWTGNNSCAKNSFVEWANANESAGTTLVSESFDGATFPPTGWSNTQVAGTGLWSRVTSMTHPTMTPHSGAGMAYANFYTFAAGTQARLSTPLLNFSSATLPKVSFWMTHDTTYTNDDTILVQASTDNTNWTTLSTLHRRDGGTAAGVWLQHSVDLSAYAGLSTVYVGFVQVSAYGDNVSIDDVVVANFNRINDSANCTTAVPVLTYGTGDYYFDDTQCNDSFDADNWLNSMDPGESGSLVVYLGNSGNDTAYNVQGTLTCPSCPAGVQICKSTATWGNIPYGTSYVYAPTDEGFRIALPTSGLTAGADLPFIVTLTTTNSGYTPPVVNLVSSPHNPADARVGTTTIQGACVSTYFPSNTYVAYDNFTTAPATTGTGGRCGTSPAWTSTAWTTAGTAADINTSIATPTGDTRSVRIRNANSSITRKFSTVGMDADVTLHAYLNLAGTTSTNIAVQYSSDGTNFYTLASGTGNGTNAWANYSTSVYWTVWGRTGTGFGPAAANAILNNANFSIRFLTSGSTYYVDDIEVGNAAFVNKATTCTGVCKAPDAPTLNLITDNNACVQNGIRVYFDGSLGATSYNLLRDSSSVVTGYTSGTLYNPGDSASHTYAIRAVNSSGNTDTGTQAFVDAAGTIVPTITCAPGTCTGATVVLTTEQGYSNYQWYLGGAPIGGATTYSYSATVSGNYTVVYRSGGCSTTSAITAVTVGGGANPPAVPNGSDVPGTPFKLVKNSGTPANVDATWDSACTNDTDYRILWGDVSTLNLVSNVTNGTVSSATCTLGTSGSATNVSSPSPSSGQCFFAVIDALNGTNFGRHGNNTAGNERALSGDTTFCSASVKNTTATTCN